MAGPYLLGIDIGAQSAKVALINAQGGLLNLSQISYEIEHPHPTWAEENPEIWWQAFQQGLEGAFLRSSVRKSEIAGIGISNMCPSLWPWTKRATPSDRPSCIWTAAV